MTATSHKVTRAATRAKHLAPGSPLKATRAELREAIASLKALGCEDSMILVEFWHALDRVNGKA